MLDVKFDNLRVRDDESFSDFYARLRKFHTLHVPLGEKFLNFEPVCKIVTSVPERFQVKVTAIEECRDLNAWWLNNSWLHHKLLNSASFKEEWKIQRNCFRVEEKDDEDEDGELDETMARLTKQFKARLTKQFKRILKPNIKNKEVLKFTFDRKEILSHIRNCPTTQRNLVYIVTPARDTDRLPWEWANNRKKIFKNKAMNVICSDEDKERLNRRMGLEINRKGVGGGRGFDFFRQMF